MKPMAVSAEPRCRRCGRVLKWHEHDMCQDCARRSKRYDELSEAMHSRDEGLDP